MIFEQRSFGDQRKKPVVRYLAIGCAAVVLFVWLAYRYLLGPYDVRADRPLVFTIPSGYSSSNIAVSFADGELIRSVTAFRFYVWWHKKDHLLRSGTYEFRASMGVPEIVEILTGGAEGEVSITIPEGFTVADIDRLMAEKGFTSTGAIVECAKNCDFSVFAFLPNDEGGPGGHVEGYLYPDTYFLGGEGSDPKALLSRLLATFKTKVADGLADDITNSGKPLFDIITMASLIEKEAAGDDERAAIAGILWKRLDAGIILGVDASVRYGVGKTSGEPLTRGDLESSSPYNIRAKRGLPPGPIANPGLASIKAALHPETTPYFYYLHDKKGVIHYAVTNEEHNANRAKYLQE